MKILLTDGEKIDKNSVIPVYYQLARLFERQIFEGKLKPGEALPPENELASSYGISRMTVRRAISELVQAGLVHTQKGVGTFVSKPRLDNVVFELNDFRDEISKRNMKPSTKLLGVKIVKADRRLAKKLETTPGKRLLSFQMVLSADEEPLIFEKKFVVFSKQKPILESELNDPSLSNLASVHSDHTPSMSKKVLHASVATETEARHLGIPVKAPVFMMEQTVYDSDKKPMGWGTSVFRADRYKLTSYTGWSAKDQ